MATTLPDSPADDTRRLLDVADLIVGTELPDCVVAAVAGDAAGGPATVVVALLFGVADEVLATAGALVTDRSGIRVRTELLGGSRLGTVT